MNKVFSKGNYRHIPLAVGVAAGVLGHLGFMPGGWSLGLRIIGGIALFIWQGWRKLPLNLLPVTVLASIWPISPAKGFQLYPLILFLVCAFFSIAMYATVSAPGFNVADLKFTEVSMPRRKKK